MTEAAGATRRLWIVRGVALVLIVTGLTLLVRAANRKQALIPQWSAQ